MFSLQNQGIFISQEFLSKPKRPVDAGGRKHCPPRNNSLKLYIKAMQGCAICKVACEKILSRMT